MKFLIHFKKNIFIFLLPAIMIYGCGVWGNFTTYFNLYYNTVQLFDEVENSISNNQPDLFATYDQPLNGGDNQKLQNVIGKCSKILQFNAETKYVDDALLMLGKSFYYQQNYLKATREFEELLATQKESDLRLEALLWLGKCQMKLKNFEAGLVTLKAVKEQAQVEEENIILQAALVEEIKYQISIDDLLGAIKASNDFLEVSESNETSERVAFELGKLYEDTNDLDGAIGAYEKLLGYSPQYNIELKTKLALGKVLRKSGHLEKALTLFLDMSNEDKNLEAFPQINLEKGITLADLKSYDEAIFTLSEVDTTYKTSVYSGASRYEIGNIYENIFNNYDSASVYYSKASTTLLPPEYVKDVASKNRIFSKYKNISKELNFNLDQLRYKNNPDEFVKDSTIFYDQLKEATTESNIQNDIQGTRSFSESRTGDLNTNNQALFAARLAKLGRPPVMPVESQDSIIARIVYSKFELGNLFFSEINNSDSALYYYSDIISNYSDSQMRPQTLFVLGNYYLSSGDTTKAFKAFNEIYDNFKNTDIVNAAANILKKPLLNLEFDPAQEIYQKAEDNMNSSDYNGSLARMKVVYENYPKSKLVPKALYSTGWVLENKLSLLDSAAVIYDTLTARFPQSEYSINIKSKLDSYHLEKSRLKRVIEDSLKVVEAEKIKKSLEDSATVKAKSLTENPVIKTQVGLEKEKLKTGKILDNAHAQPVIKFDSTNLNKKRLEPDEIFIKPDSLKNNVVPKDTLKKILEK